MLAAGSALAEPPTLDWRLPLPAGVGWRVVEWRAGQGVRHEEYIPRDQGIEDYRDRLLVQRFADQGMSPDAYLGHIASGLRIAGCAGVARIGTHGCGQRRGRCIAG